MTKSTISDKIILNQGITITGANNGDHSGYAVSNVGDINGDGYTDTAIGAPNANNNAGVTYIIYGTENGITQNIDLKNIPENQGYLVTGCSAGDLFGYSVAGIGDINGDGINDILVGSTGAYSTAGAGYILLGRQGMRSNINICGIDQRPTDGSVIVGASKGDRVGTAVIGNIDINNDGHKDIVLGGPGAYATAGAAYVIFGQANGIPNVNILGIDQRHDQGAVIVGGLEGDLFGSALSVGKISGDSSTDLVVGAYNSYAAGGKIGAGAVYVVNGKTGFSNLNIRGIDQRPRDGLVINGCTIGDYFGISVAIGDFNGDGKHDILVGASGSYRGDGAAYVIWGKDNLSNIGICGINERPSDGVVLDGCTNGCPTATYQTGYSVGAGDINGDGIDDMIIGAPGMTGNQGITYVAYGNKNGLSNMNLFSMSAEQGISISGAYPGIRFGQAVSSFGKCLIVGAPSAADGKGQTSIICTGTSGSALPTTQPIEYPTSMPSPSPTPLNIAKSRQPTLPVQNIPTNAPNAVPTKMPTTDLTSAPTMAPTEKVTPKPTGRVYTLNPTFFENPTPSFSPSAMPTIASTMNPSVQPTAAPTDIISSKPTVDPTYAPSAIPTFKPSVAETVAPTKIPTAYPTTNPTVGSTSMPTNTPNAVPTNIPSMLPTLDPTTVPSVIATEVPTNAPTMLATEPPTFSSTTNEPTIHPSSLKPSNLPTRKPTIMPTKDNHDNNVLNLGDLHVNQGFPITGAEGSWYSVKGIGDYNGDGYDDVIIASNNDKNIAYVIFGGENYKHFSSINVNELVSRGEGISISNPYLGILTSSVSVSNAGDVNGDGVEDIIIGLPYKNAFKGISYVVYGGSKLQSIDLANLTSDQGFKIIGSTIADLSGFAVSEAGDIDKDGFSDIIIGAWNTKLGTGTTYVIYGGNDSKDDIDLDEITPDQGFYIVGSNLGDFTGFSVSSAGDFNGDGYDDIIIGAPGKGICNKGESYIIFGSSSIRTNQKINLDDLQANQGVKITSSSAKDTNNNAGITSYVGDINSDGKSDIIIGAPGANHNTGQIYLVLGNNNNSDIDLSNLVKNAQGTIIKGVQRGDVAGIAVSGAGDVNGDGINDFIIGAAHANNYNGKAYLIFGKESMSKEIDLANLTSDQGFVIEGPKNDYKVGWSVSGAGDLNGDGYDDLIVRGSSTCYVIYGDKYGFKHEITGSPYNIPNNLRIDSEIDDNMELFSSFEHCLLRGSCHNCTEYNND